MPVRDPTIDVPQTEKTSPAGVSALRSWWNSFQVDQSHISESKEDEAEAAWRRKFSLNLSRTLRTRQLLLDFEAGRPVLRLRSPPDLLSFPPLPRPRWPAECEVISDVINHIEWDPPEPEPFYQPSTPDRTPPPLGERAAPPLGGDGTPPPLEGDRTPPPLGERTPPPLEGDGTPPPLGERTPPPLGDRTPPPLGERAGVRVPVYCTDPANKRPFFTSSCVGGAREPIRIVPLQDDQTDQSLEFESRFESGNLQKAELVGPYDYELTLRADLYTSKHTQWFYFRVRRMRAGVRYRFTIVNLLKRSSLYGGGMKPLIYSQAAAERDGVGWRRSGSNIRYYANTCRQNANCDAAPPFYCLSWTLQFPYDGDTCYLAHCYPYTYSRLQRYLRAVTSDPAATSFCTVRVLCRSLAGNAVYMLTITSRGAGRVDARAKKGVVVTARVHPGETNGSWMMEGFLDFLLGDSDDAKLLRDTFIFKVVPMLNPDGVVVGNHRCSLAGRDLNRNYRTVLRDSFPCVWHTRTMVERLIAETDVVLYCDFHGHSRKNNVFMYGCNNRGDAALRLQERVFPLMMSKNAANQFSFKSCKFRVQKSKEGTGRIVMWKLGIRNSFTMEATFGGSTLGDRRGTHFSTRDLKSLGFSFCDTLLDYCDPDTAKARYCLAELTTLLRKQAGERLGRDVNTDCKISVSDLETSTSGSNSSDSDGLPVHLINGSKTSVTQQTAANKKKKRLRSRRDRNKLQTDGKKSDSQPKVQPVSINNADFNLQPPESTDKSPAHQNRLSPSRRKRQVVSLVRRVATVTALGGRGLPPPGGVSQVTLWQGSEPLQDCRLENLRLKPTAGFPFSRLTPTTPLHGGGGAFRSVGRCRCSTQLLHLSALMPRPQQPRPRCPRQSPAPLFHSPAPLFHSPAHNFRPPPGPPTPAGSVNAPQLGLMSEFRPDSGLRG